VRGEVGTSVVGMGEGAGVVDCWVADVEMEGLRLGKGIEIAVAAFGTADVGCCAGNTATGALSVTVGCSGSAGVAEDRRTDSATSRS